MARQLAAESRAADAHDERGYAIVTVSNRSSASGHRPSRRSVSPAATSAGATASDPGNNRCTRSKLASAASTLAGVSPLATIAWPATTYDMATESDAGNLFCTLSAVACAAAGFRCTSQLVSRDREQRLVGHAAGGVIVDDGFEVLQRLGVLAGLHGLETELVLAAGEILGRRGSLRSRQHRHRRGNQQTEHAAAEAASHRMTFVVSFPGSTVTVSALVTPSGHLISTR